MQTGDLINNGSSYDIHDLAETNAILVRTHGQNKWIHKDEQDRAVMFKLTKTIATKTPKGARLEISEEAPGYGCPVYSDKKTSDTVATTLCEIDWVALEAGDQTLKTKSFVDAQGQTRFAALVPVMLNL